MKLLDLIVLFFGLFFGSFAFSSENLEPEDLTQYYANQTNDHDATLEPESNHGFSDEEDNDVNERLLEAAWNQDWDECKALILIEWADIDTKDANGDSCLISASIFGNLNMIRFLLDQGADVDISSDGNAYHRSVLDYDPLLYGTALHFAVSNGHVDIARVLLEYGAQVDAIIRDGDDAATALHIAVNNEDLVMVELLMEFNPDLELENNMGETALDYALEEDNPSFELRSITATFDGLPERARKKQRQ